MNWNLNFTFAENTRRQKNNSSRDEIHEKNSRIRLDRLLEYKRSWTQLVNRMPRNSLPRVMKHYCPTGRRNHGRPLTRLLDTWDRDGSTSVPTAWQIYDDDDDDDGLINGAISEKMLLTIKCVFLFPLQVIFWNISHSKKKWARCNQNRLVVLM